MEKLHILCRCFLFLLFFLLGEPQGGSIRCARLECKTILDLNLKSVVELAVFYVQKRMFGKLLPLGGFL